MEWDVSLTEALHNRNFAPLGTSANKGFLLVLKAQRPQFYFKIFWELFTTFVIYTPGTNIIRTVLLGVNRKWPYWSEIQKKEAIAFLHKLDWMGEVSIEFENGLPKISPLERQQPKQGEIIVKKMLAAVVLTVLFVIIFYVLKGFNFVTL